MHARAPAAHTLTSAHIGCKLTGRPRGHRRIKPRRRGRDFSGVDSGAAAPARTKPVEFEKEDEPDPFGLDQVRRACERVQCEYLMRTVRTHSVGPS